jgi:hypothetical protein
MVQASSAAVYYAKRSLNPFNILYCTFPILYLHPDWPISDSIQFLGVPTMRQLTDGHDEMEYYVGVVH